MNNKIDQESMDTIYKHLTGVNIGEQIDEWDERGKGYYGEFLLFSEIYNHIPGYFKILMNLQIPSENGRTTEIDLLLIHQTGLYVFEAKHYTSTIYGKMDELQWTQFFKTVDNVTFPNPVLQNRWHVENLRKLIPNFPIHSFIAFTSNECTLKVTGNLPNTTLCKKDDLCKDFWEVARHLPPIIDPKEINEIFDALKIWSPMQNAKVNYEDNKSVDFYQFVEMISNSHNTQKAEMEQRYKEKEAELNKKYASKEKASRDAINKANLRTVIISTVICLSIFFCCFVLSVFIISSTSNKVDEYRSLMEQYRNDANASQSELQKFKQKWEIITDFQINGEKLKDNYVVVDYADLTNSADFGDLVNLSFSITHNGEDFYVLIDKSSMFTVVLKDGRVIETPCYSGYYNYSLGYSQSTKTLEVKKLEFSGFSADDVAFIKMTNLQIKRIKYVYNEKPLLTDYEIILYKAK